MVFGHGDRLEHGKQGEVVGPATSERLKGKGVAVLFPGNKGATNVIDVRRRRHQAPPTAPRRPSCPLPPSPPHYYVVWYVGAQVSREPPPPLPGGYTVGEQVYYTGLAKTFENGNRLEHGKQGEVMGPFTSKNTGDKGVAVLFPGNKGAVSCYLTKVCRHAATTLGPPPAPTTCACRCRCPCMGMQVSREPPPTAAQPSTAPRRPNCPSQPTPKLLAVPPAPPLSPSHTTHYSTGDVCGRTGEPRAATAAAGRLHGGPTGLLHGGESDLRER